MVVTTTITRVNCKEFMRNSCGMPESSLHEPVIEPTPVRGEGAHLTSQTGQSKLQSTDAMNIDYARCIWDYSLHYSDVCIKCL